MTQEEFVDSVRDELIGNLKKVTEDDGDTLDPYDPLLQALKKATTINEIAAICKHMAWDLPSFINWLCNKIFDDYENKNDFPAYGWDT